MFSREWWPGLSQAPATNRDDRNQFGLVTFQRDGLAFGCRPWFRRSRENRPQRFEEGKVEPICRRGVATGEEQAHHQSNPERMAMRQHGSPEPTSRRIRLVNGMRTLVQA